MANPSLAPAGIPASSSSSSCSPLPPGDSPQVQVFEFLQTADLRGQLLNLVIKKVKHFQILQFCYVWWHSCGNRNAECECRNLAPGSECQRYILLSFQKINSKFLLQPNPGELSDIMCCPLSLPPLFHSKFSSVSVFAFLTWYCGKKQEDWLVLTSHQTIPFRSEF